jgi:hypothetical protein
MSPDNPTGGVCRCRHTYRVPDNPTARQRHQNTGSVTKPTRSQIRGVRSALATMFGTVLSRRLCQQPQTLTRVPFVERPDHTALIAPVVVHVRHHGLLHEKAPGPVASGALSIVHSERDAIDVPREGRSDCSVRNRYAHLCVGSGAGAHEVDRDARLLFDVRLLNVAKDAPPGRPESIGSYPYRFTRNKGESVRGTALLVRTRRCPDAEHCVQVCFVNNPDRAALSATVIVQVRKGGTTCETSSFAVAPRASSISQEPLLSFGEKRAWVNREGGTWLRKVF